MIFLELCSAWAFMHVYLNVTVKMHIHGNTINSVHWYLHNYIRTVTRILWIQGLVNALHQERDASSLSATKTYQVLKYSTFVNVLVRDLQMMEWLIWKTPHIVKFVFLLYTNPMQCKCRYNGAMDTHNHICSELRMDAVAKIKWLLCALSLFLLSGILY